MPDPLPTLTRRALVAAAAAALMGAAACGEAPTAPAAPSARATPELARQQPGMDVSVRGAKGRRSGYNVVAD